MCKTGANEVLAALVKVEGPVAITTLCTSLGCEGTSRDHRRPVIKSLGRLIQRGLVRRANRNGLRDAIEAEYVATAAGRAFAAEGKRITSVVPGPRRTTPRIEPDSARQRMWTVFRRLKKATLPSLVELSRDDGEDAESLIRKGYKFMGALTRAKIAVELRDREGGFSPTSNGFKRYALLRDLGPLAPVTGGKWLFDPNARERIPYQSKKETTA